MEQSTGQICVSVSWKAMKITGIDDRRYWNHIPSDESRLDLITRTIFILFPLCVLLISLSLYTQEHFLSFIDPSWFRFRF